MNKRQFIKNMSFLALASTLPNSLWAQSKNRPDNGYWMPDEGDHHKATWMAYGATASAWGTTGAYGTTRLVARRDLMRVAVNLSRFEIVNMLVSPNDMSEAEKLLDEAMEQAQNPSGIYTGGEEMPDVEEGGPVNLLPFAINDLWIRDTGPTFVKNAQGQLAGVDLNFNGWGQENTGAMGWAPDASKARNGIEKQPINQDRTVAKFVLQQTRTPIINTWLVMEGGGIEVDGHGSALCTESCILNPNRNPGKNKTDVEQELGRLFGIRKTIWLPGVRARDITDAHIDFYARFVAPGHVVCGLENDPESSEHEITHQNLELINQAQDADGRSLKVTPLVAPDSELVSENVCARNDWSSSNFSEDSFAAGYIGYYLTNDCVMMSQFGDPTADKKAFDTLSELYPDRVVVQIATDGLANGGGSIHCATQQQPA